VIIFLLRPNFFRRPAVEIVDLALVGERLDLLSPNLMSWDRPIRQGQPDTGHGAVCRTQHAALRTEHSKFRDCCRLRKYPTRSADQL
jgi:hypothetical protein